MTAIKAVLLTLQYTHISKWLLIHMHMSGGTSATSINKGKGIAGDHSLAHKSDNGLPVEHLHCQAVESWVFINMIWDFYETKEKILDCQRRCALEAITWHDTQTSPLSRHQCFAPETDLCFSVTGETVTEANAGMYPNAPSESVSKTRLWTDNVCKRLDDQFGQLDDREIAIATHSIINYEDLMHQPSDANIAYREPTVDNVLFGILSSCYDWLCSLQVKKPLSAEKQKPQEEQNAGGYTKTKNGYQVICRCTIHLAATRVYKHSGSSFYEQDMIQYQEDVANAKVAAAERAKVKAEKGKASTSTAEHGEEAASLSICKPKLQEYLKQPNYCGLDRIGTDLSMFGWIYVPEPKVKFESVDCDATFYVCECVMPGALMCFPPLAWKSDKLREWARARLVGTEWPEEIPGKPLIFADDDPRRTRNPKQGPKPFYSKKPRAKKYGQESMCFL